MRQKDFNFELSCDVSVTTGEGGITLYMCENEHYDIAVRKSGNNFEAILKLNIGGIKHIQKSIPVRTGNIKLIVRGENVSYRFYAVIGGEEVYLGSGDTKYLSSEVSGGFTGVMTGIYSVNGVSEFKNYLCRYEAGNQI